MTISPAAAKAVESYHARKLHPVLRMNSAIFDALIETHKSVKDRFQVAKPKKQVSNREDLLFRRGRGPGTTFKTGVIYGYAPQFAIEIKEALSREYITEGVTICRVAKNQKLSDENKWEAFGVQVETNYGTFLCLNNSDKIERIDPDNPRDKRVIELFEEAIADE